jgi:DNA-binding FadR family transcriptional regulator
MFNVSRNVVREAIAQLRAEGIVKSRQGAGVFVVELKPPLTLRIDDVGMHDLEEFQQLFELRGVLEIAAAGLAAERRTTKTLAGIATAFRHLQKNTQSIDADLEFHRAVAAAAGNKFLVLFARFMTQHVRETIRLARDALDPKVNARIQLEEHRLIYEAIRARRPEEAREAMRVHLKKAAKRIGINL